MDHDKRGVQMALWEAQSVASTPRIHRSDKPKRDSSATVQFSSSRPDRRDPVTLNDALGTVIKGRGWTTQVNIRRLLADWDQLVGTVNAAHSHPESYRDTVLTIRTESTAWATALRRLAPALVRRLNQEVGEGSVSRVIVKGPNAPSWNHGPRSVRGGRGPRDTYG